MEKKQIEIEEIKEKQTQEGKDYWVLRSKGEGYFVWEKKLIEGVNEGDTVTITYEPGKFPKVSEIVKSEGSGAQAEGARSDDEETVSKQQSIHRSVALQCAVEFGKDIDIAEGYKRASKVVKMAKEFLGFLQDIENREEDPKE